LWFHPRLTTDDTDSAIYGDTDNTDNEKKKYPRNPRNPRNQRLMVIRAISG
jgi:hypothetical protein